MAEEKGYQGWKNYETWAVKLWIDNEENSYRYWQARTLEAIEEVENGGGNQFAETSGSKERILLAGWLKDEFDDDAEGLPVEGLYADLLNAALSEIDWYEIAESMLEEVRESEEVSR